MATAVEESGEECPLGNHHAVKCRKWGLEGRREGMPRYPCTSAGMLLPQTQVDKPLPWDFFVRGGVLEREECQGPARPATDLDRAIAAFTGSSGQPAQWGGRGSQLLRDTLEDKC